MKFIMRLGFGVKDGYERGAVLAGLLLSGIFGESRGCRMVYAVEDTIITVGIKDLSILMILLLLF
jgi:hypothetical protein